MVPPRRNLPVLTTEIAKIKPENVLGKKMAIARLGIIARKLSYLRRRGDTQTKHVDTIRAVAPKYGHARSACFDLDPIGSGSGSEAAASYIEKQWTPRVPVGT